MIVKTNQQTFSRFLFSQSLVCYLKQIIYNVGVSVKLILEQK